MSHPLTALVIDDERPALDELTFLLGHDARVGEVLACDSATEALRLLQDREVDVVFLDIQMPGLSGLDLAQVLARFRVPPPVVFVTAHEQHALEAFDLNAVDYVLKPVRGERLAEAVRRVLDATGRQPGSGRRADPRGARRRDPLRATLGDPLRGGARRLRPAPHRLRQPPPPHPAVGAGGAVGRAPASSGSTARCWCRSPTSTSSTSTAASARSWWAASCSR